MYINLKVTGGMMPMMFAGARTMRGRLVRTLGVAGLGAVLAASPAAATQLHPAGGPVPAAECGAIRASVATPPRAGECPAARDTRELVILVHGMGRSPLSMWLLERRLRAEGYRVVQFGYRSTRGTVAERGAALGRRAARRMGDAPRVHFVGHSLGTVIIRSMLAQAPPERTGRVVMLAPPNQGSASADRWAPMVAWALPPIRELRTTPESTARTLALPEGVEVGIIAGSRDRKVRVAETQLDGARDHIVIRSFHSWMMNRSDAHRLICTFLRYGRFFPAAPSAEAP